MTNDEKRFCSKCNWNDCDYGCTCPPNEEVYQCTMYIHYHPDEVNEFEKAMEYSPHDLRQVEDMNNQEREMNRIDFL